MAKRLLFQSVDGHLISSPGLAEAPVLDLLCSHFVLTLAARQGAAFNVRRDFSGVVGLAGRHLLWPVSVLARLREFLGRRCQGNELWRGHDALDATEFLARFGVWRGPYDEATLFFFLDDYAKDQPRDLIAVLTVTAQWLGQSLKKQSTLVEKNINSLAGQLQLKGRARVAAVRNAGTLPARHAQHSGEFRSTMRRAFAAMAEVAGVNAQELGEALRAGSRLERIGWSKT